MRPLLLAFLCMARAALGHAAEPLTAPEAVRVAEEYVAEQGYTNKPANRGKLRGESFNRPVESIDAVLKTRANFIQPKAMGVRAIQVVQGKPGWTVGFYLQPRGDGWWKRVLVVTMERDGSDPIVQHTWVPREFFRPEPATPQPSRGP